MINLCSGYGQYHTNEANPEKPNKPLTDYITIDISGIKVLVKKPQQVNKAQAQWLIPSTLPSRSFAKQEEQGQYYLLWADLDTEPKELAIVCAVLQEIIGNCDYVIYTSKSATKDNQKARIIIFLDEALNGNDWNLCQQALNERLESKSIKPDRANERTAQLCYLPNKGNYYNFIINKGKSFNPLIHFKDELEIHKIVIARAEMDVKRRIEEASKRKEKVTYTGTGAEAPNLIKAFNDSYSVESILIEHGYKQKGSTFCHPNSSSGSYAVSIQNDRVHSLSSSDPLYSDGKGSHDAFSAFTVLMHDNEQRNALIDAGDNWLFVGADNWNKIKQKEYAKAQAPTTQELPNNTNTTTLAGLAGVEGACFDNIIPNEIKTKIPPVLALSVCLIPEPYQAWLADVSHRMQTPPDFATVSALVITGSIIGSGCSIKPKAKDGWEVIPNVWGACIGRPSVMLKSPSMKEPMQLVEKLQAKYGEKFEQEEAEAEFDSLATEAKLKDIKGGIAKAAKGKGKDGVVKNEDMLTLKASYMELKKDEASAPVRRLFKTNETSIQSMTVIQNENPRGVLTFRDELTGLLVQWDREDGADERAYFLEGWNGDGSYTDVKIGRGVTDAKNICISLLGGIQPDKLNRYLYQAMKGNNDGLMQRLQLAVYPDESSHWVNIDIYPNKEAKQRAYEVIERLADMDFTQYGAVQGEYDERAYYRFSEAGQVVFNEWLEALQAVKIKQEDNPLMIEHFGKFRSLMPSLALIFHLIDMASGKTIGAVSEQAAKLAVQWCDYLESHARRIYAMAENPEHGAAIKLSEKIKAGKLPNPFTIKTVYDKGWHGLKDKTDVHKVCDILIEEHWLIMGEKPKNKVGRPPLPNYYINPLIFENG